MKRVLALALLALLLVSCAAFSYRYYGLDVEAVTDADKGKLLGPKPEDDLPLTACKATSDNKAPCVVLTTEEFFKLRRDYNDVVEKLKACEAGKQ